MSRLGLYAMTGALVAGTAGALFLGSPGAIIGGTLGALAGAVGAASRRDSGRRRTSLKGAE